MYADTAHRLTASPAEASLPTLPDFEGVHADDFPAALAAAMQQHRRQLDDIAADPAAPTVANTLAALDAAGERLVALQMLFDNLCHSLGTPALQAVQAQLAAPLAAHEAEVLQHAGVNARLQALADAWPDTPPEELGPEAAVQAVLAPAEGGGAAPAESWRLLQRLRRDAWKAGAGLDAASRDRMNQLAQRHAELTTRFAHHVLHDEQAFALPLAGEAEREGLPDFVLAAARQAGAERGLAQPVVTLSRSLIVPFLTFSPRRDLREAAWRAWTTRGCHAGAHDNRPLAAELLALRREQAALMGQPSYAHFKLQDTMAGRPEAVWALLDDVWPRALQAFERERQQVREVMAEEMGEQAAAAVPLEAWDWRYRAERLRQRRLALDEAELKPYFPLPAMVAAAFECAQRLFGLRFIERPGQRAYHGDVQVYEVRDAADGRVRGLFLHDNFARPGKRSGAWMSLLAGQRRNGGLQAPVVLNNNNFARAEPGQPALLSPDDVRTLFHEFGHGLHGLLSDVHYRRLGGTQVLRDFVELPSQLMEHWGEAPEVLARHARHWRTGAPLPAQALARLQAARRFGQGYDTVRYTASAIVDLAAHSHAGPIEDVEAFEAQLMRQRGLPAACGLNHRLPHFQHLFAGDSYAAGYYVYLWAEVLEADAFEAFTEAGGLFDAATAQRLRRCILARGDSVAPAQAFEAFRGRPPRTEPMLRQRGLIE